MNQQRIDRVLEGLQRHGMSQALICDPLSIWYLTGYYTEPYERFLASKRRLRAEQLAVEVALLEHVPVDDTQMPDADACERLDDRAPQATAANHGNALTCKLFAFFLG